MNERRGSIYAHCTTGHSLCFLYSNKWPTRGFWNEISLLCTFPVFPPQIAMITCLHLLVFSQHIQLYYIMTKSNNLHFCFSALLLRPPSRSQAYFNHFMMASSVCDSLMLNACSDAAILPHHTFHISLFL